MAKVAIMGYGTVGSGVYDIIKTNSDKLSRSANGESVDIKYILDIRDFDDHPEKELFTKEFNDILNDDEVSVVAEVMGGLHPAYEFTKSLLEAGKSVVTSNKELVATYGTELLEIARGKNVNYFFEASVGGGIPIIRPMHQCLTANNILKIAGILNGTTNYILDQMIRKGKTFETALKDAQNNGFAERNPAADIEGHDACRKIAILASLASGKMIDYNDIDTDGITNITLDDVKYAAAMDSVIKLIGYAQFDENGKLFSVTFHEQLARGTAEEHFEAASKRFTETFGAPAVQDDNGIGTQYLEWQDKSSGTALGLTYSDLGTTDPTLMISVFEKSRYVEAGTGDWK